MPPRVARAMLGSVNSQPGPLGDDMLLFDREEYDPEQGTWRALAPGDPGRANR